MEDYIVINDSNFSSFISSVNAHIRGGYKPCGGLVINKSIAQGETEPSPVYYQALIRRKSGEDEEPKSDFLKDLEAL